MKLKLRKKTNSEKMSFTAYMVAVYFALLPLDLLPFAGIGIVLKAIVLIPVLFRVKKWVIRLDCLTVIMCIYLLYMCLSSTYAVASDGYGVLLSTILNVAFTIGIGSIQTFTKKEIGFFKFALALSGILIIALTLIFMGFKDSRLVMVIGNETIDPNTLNGHVIFLLIFSAELLFNKKNFFMIIPLVAVVVFTLFVGSRGAMFTILAVMFTALVLFIVRSKKPLKSMAIFLVVLALCSVVLVIVLPYVPQVVLDRFTLDGMTGGTGRFALWKDLLDYFISSDPLRQIFGNGVGTTPYVSTIVCGQGYVAHNVWIDELICGGYVGLIILLCMQITALVMAIKSKDFFLICSFVGFVVLGISLSIVTYKPLWCTYLMIMAVKNSNVYSRANRKGVSVNNFSPVLNEEIGETEEVPTSKPEEEN